VVHVVCVHTVYLSTRVSGTRILVSGILKYIFIILKAHTCSMYVCMSYVMYHVPQILLHYMYVYYTLHFLCRSLSLRLHNTPPSTKLFLLMAS
jgi:hypothetical protein